LPSGACVKRARATRITNTNTDTRTHARTHARKHTHRHANTDRQTHTDSHRHTHTRIYAHDVYARLGARRDSTHRPDDRGVWGVRGRGASETERGRKRGGGGGGGSSWQKKKRTL
jgi:hypothetical protein